ncbi:MAG: tetratricopeptide repeat protein [Proteobacteria bacterium]|nr:tetratricopeptide repeat protein [Pseudomonadota bacterium]
MSNIFHEVDEAVRHERWLKLWQTYGKYVAGAAVALVLGVAAQVGWREYQTSQRLSESARFSNASEFLASGQAALAAQQFAVLADDAGAGYAALARLREAEALAESGDTAGAVAALDRLAADDGAGEALRELASLLALYHLIDDADPVVIEQRLAPLMRDESPWRSSARELDGLLAIRLGDSARARAIFTALAEDAAAPTAVRGRAAELLVVLGGPAGGDG